MEARVLLPRMSSIRFTCENLAAQRCPSPFYASQQADRCLVTKVTPPACVPSTEHELRYYPMNVVTPSRSLGHPAPPQPLRHRYIILRIHNHTGRFATLHCHLFRVKLRHPHERFERIQRVIAFANAQSASSRSRELASLTRIMQIFDVYT